MFQHKKSGYTKASD